MSGQNFDRACEEPEQRLKQILDREQGSLERQYGLESERWNEFRERRDRLPPRLSQAIERFRDYAWTDPEAASEFEELLKAFEDIRDLENFHSRNRRLLNGSESPSFEEALELMRRIEALSQMARNLLEGRLEDLDLEQAREQIERTPGKLPSIQIASEIDSILVSTFSPLAESQSRSHTEDAASDAFSVICPAALR